LKIVALRRVSGGSISQAAAEGRKEFNHRGCGVESPVRETATTFLSFTARIFRPFKVPVNLCLASAAAKIQEVRL
jgi:hypothetical protein